ncbi:MAG TPA: DNA recombination protein RmuC [Burkholderiaceae bacterium]|nr:DNA recombination protein RmuC [Burkholderiaceae bacterium]
MPTTPFDWILIALLGALLLLVLWLALRRIDAASLRAWRDEFQSTLRADVQQLDRGVRDEVARSAGGTRSELAQTLATFQQTLLAQQGDVARTQNEQIDSFRTQLASTQQQQADTLGRAGEQQALSLQRFSQLLTDQLRALAQSNDQRMAEVRATVEAKLSAIQADNEKKLEQVRATVDEKLHATLEQRLGESFKQVAERLEQVHRGLGEMQLLAKDVGSLNRVLTNVKTRGSFGETQLAGLLEEVFTPEQYGRNVETIPGSNARVDFALRLPGRRDDGRPLWLPIDAKFPREDYERLLDAQERADPIGAEIAAKAIEMRLRAEARSIAEKYIAAPHTADFGILFVPTEGLYAEALRRPGLVEALQRDHKIMLAGPTTLLATLNSLQMGFRTLALEKRSAEVWEVLGAVKTEFASFGAVLAKTKKKLNEAANTIEDAETRTRVMTRKLKAVEAMPDTRAQLLLPELQPDLADDESA